jgi:ketosteroid isomerase-like protein
MTGKGELALRRASPLQQARGRRHGQARPFVGLVPSHEVRRQDLDRQGRVRRSGIQQCVERQRSVAGKQPPATRFVDQLFVHLGRGGRWCITELNVGHQAGINVPEPVRVRPSTMQVQRIDEDGAPFNALDHGASSIDGLDGGGAHELKRRPRPADLPCVRDQVRVPVTGPVHVGVHADRDHERSAKCGPDVHQSPMPGLFLVPRREAGKLDVQHLQPGIPHAARDRLDLRIVRTRWGESKAKGGKAGSLSGPHGSGRLHVGQHPCGDRQELHHHRPFRRLHSWPHQGASLAMRTGSGLPQSKLGWEPPEDVMDALGAPDDREEIRELLTQYCARLDEYDIDGMVEVFVPDCVTDYGPALGGDLYGRDALRDRVRASQARFARTHHQLGQSSIRVDGDHARASTYATAWHERHDGNTDTLWLRYVDELVRTEEGWRIRRRELWVSGCDGFEGVDWRWVPRQAVRRW